MSRVALFFLLMFFSFPVPAAGWGLAAHAMITRQAIEACPEPLREDLRAHREPLVERTLEPDTRLRARDGRRESVRHFINLEHLGNPPFTAIPSDAQKARANYGARRLDRAGKLPWEAGRVYAALVSALRRDNRETALRQMGYLAHYASDAWSPLHATKNYDGQLTGNDGIHRRYETAIFERRVKFFREPGPGGSVPEERVPDVAARMLVVLREGHALVPDILAADREARLAGQPGTVAYTDALFGEVGESARSRIRGAAREVAALWTSAWIEAGRPRLAGEKAGGCKGR